MVHHDKTNNFGKIRQLKKKKKSDWQEHFYLELCVMNTGCRILEQNRIDNLQIRRCRHSWNFIDSETYTDNNAEIR